jgi:thiol-disulfide isomerase/thioredoxin
VVLVDVWATWCAPCKKWFPNTVKMHEDYAKQGLAVISLSLDGEDEAAAALEFLKEQNATFTNLRSQYGAEPEGVEAFDIDGGAVPHFKLYDRAGNLARKFATGDAGPPNHAEIVQAMEELLEKK